MVAFVDAHREDYGVESICRVLPIAPSTYYEHKLFQARPELRSARVRRDDELEPEIRRVWEENHRVYGASKVWLQMNREGYDVARCTVARLMREMGLRGAVRGKKFKTTVPDETAARPTDLGNRDFTATRPNQLFPTAWTRGVFPVPVRTS